MEGLLAPRLWGGTCRCYKTETPGEETGSITRGHRVMLRRKNKVRRRLSVCSGD